MADWNSKRITADTAQILLSHYISHVTPRQLNPSTSGKVSPATWKGQDFIKLLLVCSTVVQFVLIVFLFSTLSAVGGPYSHHSQLKRHEVMAPGQM